MEQKMTVQDAIFTFKQEISFALEDKDRSLEVIGQDIRDYADFLYELSFLNPDVEITVHDNPMGGYYYIINEINDEGEI